MNGIDLIIFITLGERHEPFPQLQEIKAGQNHGWYLLNNANVGDFIIKTLTENLEHIYIIYGGGALRQS